MNYIREAEEILNHYRDLQIANTNLEERLEEIYAQLNDAKAIEISDMPKGGGNNSPDDRICNLIYQRDETEHNLQINRNTLHKIEEILEKLGSENKEILLESFDDIGKTDSSIAKSLGISRTTLIQKRGKALKKFAVQLFGIKAV